MSEKPKENFLITTNRILNIPRSTLNLQEKTLLAHFYSFGEKGCWQKNDLLAKMFQRDERTISRWISNIKKAGEIYIKSGKGYYRTIWAKSHPDVIATNKLWYRKQQISKGDISHPLDFAKNGEQDRQNWRSESAKNSIRPRQNCLTTNNTTNKETIKDTTATPAPLPARGQASALLDDRKTQAISNVQRFTKGFGRGGRKTPIPTSQEIEQRRRAQIKALLASEKV